MKRKDAVDGSKGQGTRNLLFKPGSHHKLKKKVDARQLPCRLGPSVMDVTSVSMPTKNSGINVDRKPRPLIADGLWNWLAQSDEKGGSQLFRNELT